MTQKTYKFKKGDRLHLDMVYSILGILPHDCYHQDEISPTSHYIEDNDSGESVLFLKNVTIKININVT